MLQSIADRGLAEWNLMVRGVMQVWEVARLLGLENEFERRMADDPDGRLTEAVARAGNHCAECAQSATLLRQVLMASETHGVAANASAAVRPILRQQSRPLQSFTPRRRWNRAQGAVMGTAAHR